MHICGLTTKILGLVLTGSVCKWCVDKMPTGQNANRTKCQPDKMPNGQNANLGWHFVRDFFSVIGILSGATFWLAFCPDHLKMS